MASDFVAEYDGIGEGESDLPAGLTAAEVISRKLAERQARKIELPDFVRGPDGHRRVQTSSGSLLAGTVKIAKRKVDTAIAEAFAAAQGGSGFGFRHRGAVSPLLDDRLLPLPRGYLRREARRPRYDRRLSRHEIEPRSDGPICLAGKTANRT